MSQGKVIEYINQSRFICCVCLQDKGNRLHLLTPSNREVNVSPKRAVLISDSSIDTQRPREELIEFLKRTDLKRDKLKQDVDIKELWMLVNNEKESFSNKYLAELVFGDIVADDHIAALVRALFEDRIYFKMKDGRFLQNSEEKVLQIIKQKEEEAVRKQKLMQAGDWLKAVKEGGIVEEPPFKNEILEVLIQIALYGNEAQNFKFGKELLSLVGISDIRESRELLIKLGVWEEDENLDLIKLGIEPTFTQSQLEESALISLEEITLKGREDFRDVPTLTIDGPLTRDYDDALSIEMVEDTLKIGIHIADVSSVIAPGSPLDREAAARGSSLFLPFRHIPMIPRELSQDILSLKKGCDRRVVSLVTRFDKRGSLIDQRFVPGVIRVQRQLIYEEVNKTLGEERLLKELYRISQCLQQERIKRDALSLSLPELHIRMNDDSSLSVESVDPNTPSRMIVAEFMILYNWLAAKFCSENQIPILFRRQPEPSERLSLEETSYIYYVFQQRRKLSPLQIDTSPGAHSGIGLELYTHVTSPLRRYLDLVIQRQIGGFLSKGTPVYNKKELEEIRLLVEPVLKSLELARRNRQRYWILKFLSQHQGERYRAVVLDELKSKYRIVLMDFLLVSEIKRRNGKFLDPGQEILVEIKKSDPWDDELKLSYVNG